MKFLGKIGGRKLVMALFGALAVALNASLGLSETAVMTVGGIVATYLISQGAVDTASKGATSSNPPKKE